MQALMLAAGMGKRLAKYTKNNTKCMVPVAGMKLIDRAIEAIKKAGINKFIVVLGYQGENLKNYILENHSGELEFVFINNDVYDTTNNIYSFYLAKDELALDDTILLESDIVFDEDLIKDICEMPDSNVVAVAKYESWMDGTCVTLDEDNFVKKFVEKQNMDVLKLDSYYKTVNVYKFTKEFASQTYIPFLEAYMKIQGLNSYYETSLKYICQLPGMKLKAFLMGERSWYEIDDAQDLDIANVLFSHGLEKYELLEKKYGGFWRYPHYIDFCYLVNPYFPPKQMVEKMQVELPTLLTQYPSGLSMQNMNAERLYGVSQDHILVGNGAAELINALGHVLKGKKVAVNLPAFNEYVRCFKDCELYEIDNSQFDYQMDFHSVKLAIDECDYVTIISPDNPSGFMFDKDELLDLISYAKEKGTGLIIDESFIDFARRERRFTLLDDELINENPHLIVIKSISKSYGVPGIRLGLLASSNIELLKQLKQEMQIWNINSFGEYYLQIYQLYAKDYASACDKIVEQRERLISELRQFNSLKVYDSEANYVLVGLLKDNSLDLAVRLLDKYKLIIKDLSTKNKFKGKNYIRLAVRDQKDNDYLISVLKKELQQMLISAVIATYNAEKYLLDCLNSLARQDYLDFEVVIINDGSTDNSEPLILDFIKNHKELNIVYKKIPNGGPINARVTGAKLSTGEYMCFIDSDDYIEPNYFSSFVKAINEHHPDIVCCNYFENDNNKVIDPVFINQYLDLEGIKKTIYPYLIQDKRYNYIKPTVWAKAFKKDLYLRNVCKEDIRIGEDLIVTIPMILESKSMFLLSEPLYHYRVVEASMMNAKKPRSYYDPIKIHEILEKKIKGQEDIFSIQLDRLIAHLAFNCSITQFYSDKPKKEIKAIINENLSHPVIADAISRIDGEGLKAKLMIKALRKRNFFLMKLYSKFMQVEL